MNSSIHSATYDHVRGKDYSKDKNCDSLLKWKVAIFNDIYNFNFPITSTVNEVKLLISNKWNLKIERIKLFSKKLYITKFDSNQLFEIIEVKLESKLLLNNTNYSLYLYDIIDDTIKKYEKQWKMEKGDKIFYKSFEIDKSKCWIDYGNEEYFKIEIRKQISIVISSKNQFPFYFHESWNLEQLKTEIASKINYSNDGIELLTNIETSKTSIIRCQNHPIKNYKNIGLKKLLQFYVSYKDETLIFYLKERMTLSDVIDKTTSHFQLKESYRLYFSEKELNDENFVVFLENIKKPKFELCQPKYVKIFIIKLQNWEHVKTVSTFPFHTILMIKRKLGIEETVKLVKDGEIRRNELKNNFKLSEIDIKENDVIKEAISISLLVNLCTSNKLDFVLPFDTKMGKLRREIGRQLKLDLNVLQIKCGKRIFKDDELVSQCLEEEKGKFFYCCNENANESLKADYNLVIFVKDFNDSSQQFGKYLFDRNYLIEAVKLKLRDNLNVPIKSMKLYHNNRLLSDKCSLENEEINDNDSLSLLLEDKLKEDDYGGEIDTNSMTIIVKNGTSSEEKKMNIKINKSRQLVRELKEKICDELKLDCRECLLLFNHDIMRDNNDIDIYELTNGSEVTICWIMYVKSIDNVGAVRSFPLMYNQKVSELKEIIHHYMNYEVKLQILQYNGEALDNDSKLIEDYEVEPMATIYLVSTLRGGP